MKAPYSIGLRVCGSSSQLLEGSEVPARPEVLHLLKASWFIGLGVSGFSIDRA